MTEKNKNPFLYGIIGLLAVLLVVQTCAVVYFLFNKPARQKQEVTSLYEQAYAPPAKAGPAYGAYSQNPFFDDTLSSMTRLQQHMDRMFDHFMRGTALPALASLGSPSGFDFLPAADMEETSEAYIIRLDVPGIEKDKIEISVRDGLLTVQGERQSESEHHDQNQGYYSQERTYGSFARSINLPGPVDEANVKANYNNGVLTITLPKTTETEQPVQKIPVQ